MATAESRWRTGSAEAVASLTSPGDWCWLPKDRNWNKSWVAQTCPETGTDEVVVSVWAAPSGLQATLTQAVGDTKLAGRVNWWT